MNIFNLKTMKKLIIVLLILQVFILGYGITFIWDGEYLVGIPFTMLNIMFLSMNYDNYKLTNQIKTMELTLKQLEFLEQMNDSKAKTHQENQFRLQNKYDEFEVIDHEVVIVNKTNKYD